MKKVLSLLALFMLIAISASAKGIETSYRNALVFAYSQANSVYEDDNIKVQIYDEQLWAINKTNKTIFIDLSQCFLVHNGSSYPMFSKEDGASKKGVSTSVDEFITIAPSTGGNQKETFIVSLTSAGFYGKFSTTESPTGDFSVYDKRLLNLVGELVTESMKADPKGKEYKGTVSRHLSEDESVSSIGATLAYAFNKRAEDWNSVSISTWVCDVMFAPYYVSVPKALSKKEQQGFGVKETESALVHIKGNSPFEFDADRSPIIVTDWEGDFKKGTFVLSNTRIAKMGSGNKGARAIAGVLTLGYSELLRAGMKAALESLDVNFYKSKIQFDGENSDWGTLKFVKNKIETGQK